MVCMSELQCCINKKRLCLQCESYQYNQQLVLRISFSNSTFLSRGIKKTCFWSWTSCKSHLLQSLLWTCQLPVSTQPHTLRVWARKQKRAMLRSTCLLSSSSRYPGNKWGGPLILLGLRG